AMVIHSFPDLEVVDVNAAWELRTGFARGEAIGRNPYELGLWVDRRTLERAVQKLRKEGKLQKVEVHYRDKAGDDFNGLLSSEVVDFANGQYVLSILEDISVRKRAEEAFRASDAKFRRVFQEAGVGMVIGSADLRFIAANRAFCEM